MAVTDIAEDDLDEMMREEAEDVFYEDGRIAKSQMWSVLKRAWVWQVGCRAETAAPVLRQGQTGWFVSCGYDQG